MRSLAWILSVVSVVTTIVAARATGGTRILHWAADTSSPQPSTAETSLLGACADTDGKLDAVAAEIAAGTLSASDPESLAQALLVAGEPHLRPRAWMVQGRRIDRGEANTRLAAWLGSAHTGHLRCGIARSIRPGSEAFAAVAIDAQADLQPVPRRARTSSWIDLEARILVPATGAKVVILGPTGSPRTLPTSFADGRVRARANVDQPGPWLFQVLLDGGHGPTAALEALVFAGVEPPASPTWSAVPGEEVIMTGDLSASLERMVTAARQSEAVPPLARQTALDRIARQHAEHMMRSSLLAHDTGDGNPQERVERAGIAAREVGENVAHAATIALAHRALWASPSHRGNMLERRFEQLGIGIVPAPDGTVWVTELFAR